MDILPYFCFSMERKKGQNHTYITIIMERKEKKWEIEPDINNNYRDQIIEKHTHTLYVYISERWHGCQMHRTKNIHEWKTKMMIMMMMAQFRPSIHPSMLKANWNSWFKKKTGKAQTHTYTEIQTKLTDFILTRKTRKNGIVHYWNNKGKNSFFFES